MIQVIEERWKKFENWSLKSGQHSPDSTFCVMEAVAYVAGEKWSDSPECACPVISAFLRSWNDALPSDAERDRLLKHLIPKLVNSRKKSVEEKRALMATDWLIRVHTPAWLRLAGLIEQAKRLEELPEITATKQFPSIKSLLEAIRQDAVAGRAAARTAGRAAGWDAAWDAVWDAARDAVWAAAWDAGRAAAWDAGWDAAWDAVWDAARDAVWAAARTAGRDAPWDAAWAAARDAARDAAGKKLAPTVAKLQESALELVERMIAA